jgi:hypothetical protein
MNWEDNVIDMHRNLEIWAVFITLKESKVYDLVNIY